MLIAGWEYHILISTFAVILAFILAYGLAYGYFEWIAIRQWLRRTCNPPHKEPIYGPAYAGRTNGVHSKPNLKLVRG